MTPRRKATPAKAKAPKQSAAAKAKAAPAAPASGKAAKHAATDARAAAPAAGQQRGKPFRKGVSGNPAGRRPGTRNRATVAIAQLFEGEAEAIGRKAVELALAGDPVALRLVVERLLSPARERAVDVPMPELKTAADLPVAVAQLLSHVAAGELTPTEGERLAGLLGAWRSAVELTELERRIAAIEERSAKP